MNSNKTFNTGKLILQHWKLQANFSIRNFSSKIRSRFKKVSVKLFLSSAKIKSERLINSVAGWLSSWLSFVSINKVRNANVPFKEIRVVCVLGNTPISVVCMHKNHKSVAIAVILAVRRVPGVSFHSVIVIVRPQTVSSSRCLRLSFLSDSSLKPSASSSLVFYESLSLTTDWSTSGISIKQENVPSNNLVKYWWWRVKVEIEFSWLLRLSSLNTFILNSHPFESYLMFHPPSLILIRFATNRTQLKYLP